MTEPSSPLQIPDYRRFWLSRLASTAAGQMLMVALGWQMYDLTGSAWDLGLVGLALAPQAWMATLPVMGYVVGSALCTGLVARAQANRVSVSVLVLQYISQQFLSILRLKFLSLQVTQLKTTKKHELFPATYNWLSVMTKN